MSSDMLELLALMVLAGIVLYRLKSVIGTRTGHEGPPDIVRRQQQAEASAGPVAVPDADPYDDEPLDQVPEGSQEPLDKIRAVEPGFDLREFTQGARGAYEMILMAYEEGDRSTLQSLLAPDVYKAFESGIKSREEAGLRVEARFIGVREAEVDEIAFEDGSNIADVSIRFVGELITAVRDQENRIVEGDPNEIRRQADVWTFSREMGSSDPNWLLTGTGSGPELSPWGGTPGAGRVEQEMT
ncbi:MAG: Tim44/TimA family putative adaptor protein, partial [Paracoccaceae bacterium]